MCFKTKIYFNVITTIEAIAALEIIADIRTIKTFVAKLFAEKNIVKKVIQWCVDTKKNVSFTKLAIVLSNMKD